MCNILVIMMATVLAWAAHAQQVGYSGQQTRDIKALSAEETADLLAGRGMGLAKAGELNHYPGPAHVLELQDKLRLTPDQINAARASFERMATAAKPLGAILVQRERSLDDAFKNGGLNRDALSQQTAEIGALQGQLRAVHLTTHLETRALLTSGQTATYDSLRGYADAPASISATHHHG